MSISTNNEITVKVICTKDELLSILLKQNYSLVKEITFNDTYFIPCNLELSNLSTREILSHAIIIRKIFEDDKEIIKITYKTKEFAENGDIINQSAVNCSVYNFDDAKSLITAIGYKEIMNIKENDIICKKDDYDFPIKDIVNGDILIEFETIENKNYNTIEKLKTFVKNLNIPILENEYFIKKAEIELDKILKRN